MVKLVVADGIGGGFREVIPGEEMPGEFEIHFANVRVIEPDTNLRVRLTVDVARQLANLINATLPNRQG